MTSTPWKPRLWARPNITTLAQRVQDLYFPLLRDPLLTARLTLHTEDDELAVRWHPAEDALRIRLLDDGRLRAEATTNAIGPGYHALLISLLDGLAKELKITWDFAAEEADETGFASERSAQALQQAMMGWLRGVIEIVLEMDAQHHGLTMSVDTPRPDVASFAFSPMGTWTREQLEGALQSESNMHRLAAEFFPWWSLHQDAAFWRGVGNVICWCDFPWVSPRDQVESELGNFALSCLERADSLGGIKNARVTDELRSLMRGSESIVTPGPGEVGYRRLTCDQRLLGYWRAKLPGYFFVHVLEEGKNLQFEGPDQSIYVSAFSVGSPGGDMPSARDLLETGKEKKKPDLVWENGDVLGEARWEEAETHHNLMVKCTVDGRLLLLTITVDPMAPREWAEEVAVSVTHPSLSNA